MDINELTSFAINNRKIIYEKVDKFFIDSNIRFLPKLYYICSFKIGDYEERSKWDLINFHEHYVEIRLNKKIETFQWNYIDKKINKPIEFYFSLTRKDVKVENFNEIIENCKKIYLDKTKNINVFRTKGLRNLLVESHEFKINVKYHDYLSIIRGFEEDFYITEQEFNEYKKNEVSEYITDKAISYLKK